MKIRFYQIECGDAACIMYDGIDGKPHFIFVDSGYERTFRDILANEIKSITSQGGQIDLWIVSHIHDDHIGGVVSYIKSIQAEENKHIVLEWWYNPAFEIVSKLKDTGKDISEAKSFAQGENVTSYLYKIGKLPKSDIVQGYPLVNFFGLNLTILSPDTTQLNKLREKYKDERLQTMDYHLLTEISEPASIRANDYLIKIEDFNINKFEEDNSIENGSSIAILTELNGKRILWLADAPPSIIVTTLKRLGYSEDTPLIIDLIKVSHHGSRGNNSSELFGLIVCNKYLFSANGDNKYQLPTKECMARILRNKKRPKDSCYQFLFTFDTPYLRSIFEVDGEDVYTRLNFEMIFADNDKWLDVLI